MNYWQKRLIDSQNKLTDIAISETEKQMERYYINSMNRLINDFVITYNKVLESAATGQEITPAHLYMLDKYQKLQVQLSSEMERLGNKQIAELSKAFAKQWDKIYASTEIPNSKAVFSTLSNKTGEQMINQIWCADGKAWSERVWDNCAKLQFELNDQLSYHVLTGKKTTQLVQSLEERFSVANYRAKTLVRTELAHIQTQAAAERYKDYGITYYEFLADTDERTCDECAELDGKRFKLSDMIAGFNCPPIHPNDRCCIIPVVENQNFEIFQIQH